MEKYFIKKLIAPNQYSIIGMLALAVILFFSAFLQRRVVMSGTDTFFSIKLAEYLSQKSPVLIASIYTAIVLLIAFFIMKINEEHRFIRERTVVPSFIFLFLITFSEYDIKLNAGLIGSFFLLLALDSFFKLYRECNAQKTIFDTFFILSLGSFFHIHLLFLSAIFLLGITFAGYFHIRNLFAAIIGFVTPILLAVPLISIYGFDEFWNCTKDAMSMSYNIMQKWEFSRIFYSVFFFISLVISAVFFFMNNLRDDIKARRMQNFIFFLTLCICLLGLYQMKNFFTYYPLFLLCISLITGYYFTLSRSKYIRYMLIVFLLIPIVFTIYSCWSI